MNMTPTFLKSKVARRVFALFVLCALVPISVLAVLSFSQVTKEINRESKKSLQQKTKALSMSIYQRLCLLESELKILASSIYAVSGTSMRKLSEQYDEDLKKRFKGLILVNESEKPTPIFGNISYFYPETEEEKRHLASGKTFLLTRFSEAKQISIYMVRAIDPQNLKRGILVGEANAMYLWGLDEYNTLPSASELCILDQSNNVIYSTLPVSPPLQQKLGFQTSRFSLGQFELRVEDTGYIANFWSIPLKFHFFIPRWTVILSFEKNHIFASLSYFKKTFPLVILLSLLLVVFLSVFQIRKIMLPLERLKDGTERIAMGEFNTAVDVDKGDEFEKLAVSFNKMASKIARQFNTLSTLAEIDRAILSSLDTEKIVNAVLTRIHTLFTYDWLGFTVFDSEPKDSARTYIGEGSGEGVKVVEQIPLKPDDTQELRDNPENLFIDADKPLAQYLRPLNKRGVKWYLVLPILFENRLLGMMTFGYLNPPSQTQEDRTQARQFADQVAVALANAHLIEVRKRAEEALHQANVELENRVEERTKDLTLANEHLQREIGVRQQAEIEMQRAKEEADMANRSKSEFLANMSHELRTPLNAIIGFNELIVDKEFGELNEMQEEYLNDMLESSYHLLSLINDILDLSKVEAGKLELKPSEFDLKELLSRSLVIIKEKAGKHGINVSMDADSVPETIRGDERKIKQIIYNLLSNALKFTPDGGSVSLSARSLSPADGYVVSRDGEKLDFPMANEAREKNNGNFVIVSVEDSGIGIKLEDQQRIFEPFEQADDSATRRYQGTGLGLPLTKRLVELHGGRIWLESEGKGKGSTFSFIIPVQVWSGPEAER